MVPNKETRRSRVNIDEAEYEAEYQYKYPTGLQSSLQSPGSLLLETLDELPNEPNSTPITHPLPLGALTHTSDDKKLLRFIYNIEMMLHKSDD